MAPYTVVLGSNCVDSSMARPPAASRCRSRITARPPDVRFPTLTLVPFPAAPGDVFRYVPGGQVPWCTPKMCTAGCSHKMKKVSQQARMLL